MSRETMYTRNPLGKIEQEVHISGLTPGAVQVSGTTWLPHTQCS